ncbi:heparan-alpha-glucosaminide N-acetyltransferase domain-containing protein [Pseudoxanthomonas sp.]|uniref:acyltransferase family protein n=1 Tax=Pseudoxanthomonas sp. TaxID=1871049 RepID=UPI00261CDB54|nr:heparan-alpha-glucosaminide N-acetyltransferase domain-containing protein [Pseudoxanthomonas sp.]WDS35449.1 MAG: heparan-alpha-glucosaminide N-acetyltransferase domain-containing protein [Pseudoxanthomonas sp.]
MSAVGAAAPDKPGRERFLSLDVFRGLTIFVMILVNTAGPGAASYAQLSHTKWFGFTLADLVFPTFLFVTGNALAFTAGGGSERDFLLRTGKRAALIFLCGFLMYWYPFVHQAADGGWAFNAFGQTRVMGVLQRIALCYFAGALAVRYLPLRALPVLAIGLLLAYWGILYGFGAAGAELDKLGNAGTRLDLWLLGRDHLYRKDGGFDPEGVLGTLPAIVNVIGGFLAGRFLMTAGKTPRAVRLMLTAGVALVLLALAWHPLFPIAKKLWTGSFVLLTVGLDLLLLGACVGWIELGGHAGGSSFFTAMGKNPLAIYLFSELFVVTLQLVRVAPGMGLYDWVGISVFQALTPGPLGSFLCALAYTLACWALAWWLDRRRIYIRL